MYKQQRGNESCEAIQNLLSSSVIRDFSFLSDIGLFPLMPHVSSVFYVTLQCFHYLTCACMFRTDSNSDLQPKIKKKRIVHKHCLLQMCFIIYCSVDAFYTLSWLDIVIVRGKNCCIILHNIYSCSCFIGESTIGFFVIFFR